MAHTLTNNNNIDLSIEANNLPFIEANTLPISLDEIENNHIIPVYTKDNSILISQHQFIATTNDIISNKFDAFNGPYIRVSHPVKGRIPSARYKKAADLLPHEETLYYERMMFVYTVPSVTRYINGEELKLVIGGVKAYNKDNLNRNSKALQHFTLFIGFQVKVCTNLCVWSDGENSSLKVSSLDMLGIEMEQMITTFEADRFLSFLEQLSLYTISEQQFAHLIGKCKMYNYLDKHQKQSILPSGLNETQLSAITKQYYEDDNFSASNGEIDLWSLYNLFTGALKSSYIDSIIDNNIIASKYVHHLADSMLNHTNSWYLPH